MKFNPGDLCRIVDHPNIGHKELVGKYCVLVNPAPSPPFDAYAPRWFVSGLPDSPPPGAWLIGEVLLEKVPPPPLDEEIVENTRCEVS